MYMFEILFVLIRRLFCQRALMFSYNADPQWFHNILSKIRSFSSTNLNILF